MQTLMSMELTKAEAKQDVEPNDQLPKYPWGLTIELDADALKKLGITSLPAVGQSVSIVAKAEVQSASESQYKGDKDKRMNVSLQITDMALTMAVGALKDMMYGKD